MSEHSSRNGLQTAERALRTMKSASRIAKAAAASGLPGAASAAVKESLPFLLKLALGVLIAVYVFLLMIFSGIPNMFFGYENAEAAPVVDMTKLAMSLGGTYSNLDTFVAAQVDAAVTSLIEEYAQSGVTIDRVDVEHSFTEEDLVWVIAINSAAYQQDLNIMTPEVIHTFVSSHLRYAYNLFSDDETVLTVHFDKLDPEVIMEQMHFDKESRTWACAIQEVLRESDALTTYSGYFKPYHPNYGGDPSGPADFQHGSNYSNEINLSEFKHPETKNNLDLSAYAIQAWENNWGYVWGTYGNVLTQSLFDYKLSQYPDGVGNYEDFIQNNWLGRRTTDCVGLIKGYGWLDPETMRIGYAVNGMPDYAADGMQQAAVAAGIEGADYGSMDTLPEIVGLMLWKPGHVGVYIGGGYAIESAGTKVGVVKTKVEERGWGGWYKIPFITYLED